MKKMNEDGITLVELLATLVLVTIVTAVIWNTVFISMRYTTIETKKMRLQQEANYVIAEIQRYHRQCDSYKLTVDVDGILIEECTNKLSDELPNLKISNGFVYESPSYDDEPVKSKEEDLSFTLTIADAENDKLKVIIPTNISRLKSGLVIGGEKDD